jgi:hypothetical protein
MNVVGREAIGTARGNTTTIYRVGSHQSANIVTKNLYFFELIFEQGVGDGLCSAIRRCRGR